jgi:RimJ/RimL family protein N-acetyltransferase
MPRGDEFPDKYALLRWFLRRHRIGNHLWLAISLLRQGRLHARFLLVIGRRILALLGKKERGEFSVWENSTITMSDVTLESTRLILRSLRTSDLDCIVELMSPLDDADAGDKRGSATQQRCRREAQLALEISRSLMAFVAVQKGSDTLVGMFTLTRFRIDGETEHELGYRIHHNVRGRGLAAEGARTAMEFLSGRLGLDRFIAIIEPTNLPSIRVAEKLGMRYQRDWVLGNTPVRVFTCAFREASAPTKASEDSVCP